MHVSGGGGAASPPQKKKQSYLQAPRAAREKEGVAPEEARRESGVLFVGLRSNGPRLPQAHMGPEGVLAG